MKNLRPYEPPSITTLTADEILNLIGPAQASASGDGDMSPAGVISDVSGAGQGGSRKRAGY
jgi:hypothetical protein